MLLAVIVITPLLIPAVVIGFYVWLRNEEKKALAEKRKTLDHIMQAANRHGGL